jgi:hypothetical protein
LLPGLPEIPQVSSASWKLVGFTARLVM